VRGRLSSPDAGQCQAFPIDDYRLKCAGMIRFFTIIMTAVLMAVFLPACSDDPQVRAKVDAARARNDAPPIWIITDPQNDIGTLYIFGAVHILPEDFDWLRPDLTAAFNSAGTVP